MKSVVRNYMTSDTFPMILSKLRLRIPPTSLSLHTRLHLTIRLDDTRLEYEKNVWRQMLSEAVE